MIPTERMSGSWTLLRVSSLRQISQVPHADISLQIWPRVQEHFILIVSFSYVLYQGINVPMTLDEIKFSVCVQSRYIGGGPSAFKLPHTAPPIYLNSDLKGPLTSGVRETALPFLLIPLQTLSIHRAVLDLDRTWLYGFH